MDITGKNIWQIAAGDGDRAYPDICLEWDIILNGPGSLGPWPECRTELKTICSDRKISDLQRFCVEIKEGDLIVLHVGTQQVFGVGQVVGYYLYSDLFNDLDGWDIGHLRRVKWLWKYKDEPKTFKPYALKFGDTTQLLNPGEVQEWLAELNIPSLDPSWQPKLLPPEELGEILDMKNISDYLFDRGIAASSIDKLVQGMDELARIAAWYERSREQTSERETVAYLVVPLLRDLGWTPQKMAIEWQKVDLALFGNLPRTDSNLAVTVEAKNRGYSVLKAKSQAEWYATQPGREKCLRLIVTDGIRYAIFLRNLEGTFNRKPSAYLNLTGLRKSYPILECKGAREALLLMAADWDGRIPE
jgi:hypothetical protein